jgi:hypothetical protein
MDNYGTRKTPKVRRWFLQHPDYPLHFHTDLSELAESSRAVLRADQARPIRGGTFCSVRALETAINRIPGPPQSGLQPFVWTADADLILGKVQRFCEANF